MYVDVTDATFETEILNRSDGAVVVIDLWAPWCGPCKTLGPIIEKVIDETEGRVVLAKVNVDENPRISQSFQVQSIPAVFAIKDKKIVDNFVGALPEGQLRAWVSRLAPPKSKADILVDAAIESNDQSMLWQALDLQPDHVKGVTALASMLTDAGRGEDALALLARIPESAETITIAARARLGATVAPADADAPDPHAATVEELEGLLDKVKADDEARQRYVDLLAVMGEDERVLGLRKQLAARLF